MKRINLGINGMKYFYRYYFFMFEYHKRDTDSGRIKSPAWASAFLQFFLSLFLTLFSIVAIVLKLFDAVHLITSVSKLGYLFFFIFLPALVVYFLLYKYLNVSKIDGKTDRFYFETNKRIKIIYWIWFFVSGPIFTAIAILFARDII